MWLKLPCTLHVFPHPTTAPPFHKDTIEGFFISKPSEPLSETLHSPHPIIASILVFTESQKCSQH